MHSSSGVDIWLCDALSVRCEIWWQFILLHVLFLLWNSLPLGLCGCVWWRWLYLFGVDIWLCDALSVRCKIWWQFIFVACTLSLLKLSSSGCVCVDVYSGGDFIYTMIDNISIGINPVEAWEILRRLGYMGESWDCSWRSIGWVWEAMAGSFLLTL